MNIVVYVKAVVDPDKAKDEVTTLEQNTTVSSLILNPYDKNAIETALQLKEKYSGKVTAVSFGEDTATEKVLRDALALGVDEGVKITSPEYKNVSSFSTTLGFFLGKVPIPNVDYYITGREAADDNQAVVGAGIAAALNTDFVDNVDQIDFGNSDGLCLTSRWDQSELTGIYQQKPLVISVTDTINTPRLPSFRAKIQAKKAVLNEISLSDFLDAAELETITDNKVATVLEIPKTVQKTNVIFNLEEDDTAVTKLLAELQNHNIL